MPFFANVPTAASNPRTTCGHHITANDGCVTALHIQSIEQGQTTFEEIWWKFFLQLFSDDKITPVLSCLRPKYECFSQVYVKTDLAKRKYLMRPCKAFVSRTISHYNNCGISLYQLEADERNLTSWDRWLCCLGECAEVSGITTTQHVLCWLQQSANAYHGVCSDTHPCLWNITGGLP